MYEIIPFKSIGQFRLNTNIELYLNNEDFEFTPKESEEDIWDTYDYKGGILSIQTTGGNIESITCTGDCYIEGRMLIGMDVDDFFTAFNFSKEDTSADRIYFFDNSQQDVYEIECWEIQLWVDLNNRIVSVII